MRKKREVGGWRDRRHSKVIKITGKNSQQKMTRAEKEREGEKERQGQLV